MNDRQLHSRGWLMRLLLLCICFVVGTAYVTAGPAAPEELEFFFGNLHAHTSFSDGSSTPRSAFRYARDEGQLDFMAITEHNHAEAERGAGDRADGRLIATDPTLYDRLIVDANKATLDGKFVALYGQEFSSISKGNHLNVLMADKVIETKNGDYLRLFTIGWMQKYRAELFQFNHPWDGKNRTGGKMRVKDVGTSLDTNYGFDQFTSISKFIQAVDDKVSLIEVLNGPGTRDPDKGGAFKPGGTPGFYIAYLNLGLHVAPTANQDNHYENWGTMTEARTVVLAPQLTRSEVLKALKSRRAYATDDKGLCVTFTSKGKPMGSRLPAQPSGSEIELSVRVDDTDHAEAEEHLVVLLYDDRPGGDIAKQVAKQEIANNETSQFRHTPKKGKGYYFVQVVTSEGRRAWTAPIWFE